jgi:hypothetical protein
MKLISILITFSLFVAVSCSRGPSQPKPVKINNFNYDQARSIIDGQKKSRGKHFKVAKKQRKQEIREIRHTHRS